MFNKHILLKLGMCNICKNNIAKMFLDFFKFKIVHLIEVFLIFCKKSSAHGISKTAGFIFTKLHCRYIYACRCALQIYV